jgi:flavodoxin
MKIEIAFKSKRNTKKIANALGEALNTKPIEIDGTTIIEDADILFLGCGIYAGDVLPEVKDFVKTLNPSKVRKVVLFLTCGFGKDQTEKLKEEIRCQGLRLEERTFFCKGRTFSFVNRNRPIDTDLEQAVKFARGLCENYELDTRNY